MIDNAHTALTDAQDAVKARDFERAKQRFRTLIGTALEADGLYGLGWVAKTENRPAEAAEYFNRALEVDPRHANSHYHLARLAEADGRADDARNGYLLAIASQPDHAAARTGLERLGVEPPPLPRPPVVPGPPPRPDRPRLDDYGVVIGGVLRRGGGNGGDAQPRSDVMERWLGPDRRQPTERFGVYEYLLEDRAPLSRHAVAILDRLRIDRYPTALSFFGWAGPAPGTAGKLVSRGLVTIIAVVVLASVGILLALQIGLGPQPGPVPGDIFEVMRQALPTIGRFVGALIPLAVIALVLWPFARFLRHITTRLRIERGRLQVERGLLTRRLQSIELWRVQNIELERRGFHMLTGDGTLVFHAVSGSEPIEVTGIARGRDLTDLYDELLDLVFLLRSNQSIKGIVQ